MNWLIFFGILAFGLVVLPVYIEGRRKPVNVAARRKATGKFAKLSEGVTHYRWSGSARGPVAVLVHGLTTPMIAWDQIAQGVGQLGYRVLCYDLYGRGLSDAPNGLQDSAFFMRQLDDLLADQGITDEVTLFGYSMGGAIVTSYAAAQPHRTKRVVLVAAAGVAVNESGFSRFCRQTPVIGDWIGRVFWPTRMRRALARTTDAPADVLAAQKAELQRQGFVRSVLSSRRGMLRDTQEAEHRKIGREGVPVVAIWGGQDDVIPISALGLLAQWNRSARQEDIKTAGHGLPYTHADDVVTILRDVFREDH